jgi:hypothetical protein
MFTITVSKEEVLLDFPFIQDKWIDVIKKDIKVDLDESKIEFYYSYGYFIPKVDDKEKYYDDMFEKCSNMLFNERLEFELSKVRVNLTLKSGNFFISDRLPKGSMPKSIRDIVTEITKVKMLVESEYHDNDKISDSIPDIDKNIVSLEIIRDVVNSDYSKSQKFDIDNILDKISKEGMDSLSDEEREFLDKKSKDL